MPTQDAGDLEDEDEESWPLKCKVREAGAGADVAGKGGRPGGEGGRARHSSSTPSQAPVAGHWCLWQVNLGNWKGLHNAAVRGPPEAVPELVRQGLLEEREGEVRGGCGCKGWWGCERSEVQGWAERGACGIASCAVL